MEWKITIKYKHLSVFTLFCLAAIAYSQNSRINIYGAGAYNIPIGDFRGADIYPGKGNANEGSSINLGAQIRIFEKYFIGIESGYFKFGPRQKVANYNIYTYSVPFLLNVSYYLNQGDFRPYITAGAGVSRFALNVQTEFFEETSNKTVPLMALSAGMDMMIADHTAVFGFIQWSYAFSKDIDFKYEHFYTITPEFNFSFISFGLGIKYWIR